MNIAKGLEPVITQAVITIVTAIIGVLVTYAISVIKKYRKLLITKMGATNYNYAKDFAVGVYHLLEDKFDDVSKSGESKKREMDKLLLEQFPALTQNQLDAINKDVWSMFNTKLKESNLLDSATETESEILLETESVPMMTLKDATEIK